MVRQIYYEDLEVGDELPTLVKHVTAAQLVKWAGASDDYYPIHYDKDFARSTGLRTVIAQSSLTVSFLAQMITDCMGELGTIKRIKCRFQGFVFCDEDVVCKGKVTKKYIQDGEHHIEVEIWAENPQGEITIPASGVFVLPPSPH